MNKLRIAFSSMFPEASLMKQILEENKVFVFEIMTSGHITIAGGDQGYYLEVNKDDSKLASEILINNGFAKNVF